MTTSGVVMGRKMSRFVVERPLKRYRTKAKAIMVPKMVAKNVEIRPIRMLIMNESRKSGPAVTPQQAITMVNAEDGVFLDLRDAAEFKKGHIVGAMNIPATKLPGRMGELEKLKGKPIVLVCKMGQQSGAASKQLKAENYEQVYKMTGGMMEWGNLQLPTVS